MKLLLSKRRGLIASPNRLSNIYRPCFATKKKRICRPSDDWRWRNHDSVHFRHVVRPSVSRLTQARGGDGFLGIAGVELFAHIPDEVHFKGSIRAGVSIEGEQARPPPCGSK